MCSRGRISFDRGARVGLTAIRGWLQAILSVHSTPRGERVFSPSHCHISQTVAGVLLKSARAGEIRAGCVGGMSGGTTNVSSLGTWDDIGGKGLHSAGREEIKWGLFNTSVVVAKAFSVEESGEAAWDCLGAKCRSGVRRCVRDVCDGR